MVYKKLIGNLRIAAKLQGNIQGGWTMWALTAPSPQHCHAVPSKNIMPPKDAGNPFTSKTGRGSLVLGGMVVTTLVAHNSHYRANAFGPLNLIFIHFSWSPGLALPAQRPTCPC